MADRNALPLPDPLPAGALTGKRPYVLSSRWDLQPKRVGWEMQKSVGKSIFQELFLLNEYGSSNAGSQESQSRASAYS